MEQEKVKNVSNAAEFFIKTVIIFTVISVLVYFAGIYNAIVFTTLAILTLIALLIKGITNLLTV